MKIIHRAKASYLVYGAGAIGSVFGGMLAGCGHEVVLVGRKEHMEAVAGEGLRIAGLLGDHMVEGLVTASSLQDVSRDFEPDAILLSVKSYDTAEAAEDLERSGFVGPDTVVVSLQNGLGNVEVLQAKFGPERVLGGRVIFGAEVTRPASVEVTVWADRVLLGGRNHVAARSLAEHFTLCGIETGSTEDIQVSLWGKVLYNVGLNPLSAILEVPYGVLGEQEQARRILIDLIREAHAVAAAEGRSSWETADQYLEVFFGRLLPATESHRSSMLQDIRSGRRTEIEAINGEVIRRGKLRGIPVPVNEVVYHLVRSKTDLSRT
ncbi:MAG: 2-dehydropantoate 2-reductase [bacterium]|nr:MAG: 2-dehydropantoate 2-reductase [bacterium]